jgi:hypothetical protein
LYGVVVERDFPVAVGCPILPQAEYVLGQGVWLGQHKGPEQAVSLLSGLFAADAWNLPGGGMDLVVIVTVYLVSQDTTSLLDGR